MNKRQEEAKSEGRNKERNRAQSYLEGVGGPLISISHVTETTIMQNVNYAL